MAGSLYISSSSATHCETWLDHSISLRPAQLTVRHGWITLYLFVAGSLYISSWLDHSISLRGWITVYLFVAGALYISSSSATNCANQTTHCAIRLTDSLLPRFFPFSPLFFLFLFLFLFLNFQVQCDEWKHGDRGNNRGRGGRAGIG
jgi:hypothetical protein